MAPLVKELESRAEVESICCITAQHRQMLDDVLRLFAITPDYDLDIMEDRQSLYTITSKCLLGLEEVFSREKPDLVLVHGDTSTTFSGALAAFYQKIAVGHVEAGLRTGDRYSPFPEEMNRTLVGGPGVPAFLPHPSQPGEPPGGGDPGGHLRHRQHGDRCPEDHRPAGLPVPHGPAEHPGLPGEAGHPGHLPPAGETMASPWRTS